MKKILKKEANNYSIFYREKEEEKIFKKITK